MVTVWAEEQEDTKKLDKWLPCPCPGSAGAGAWGGPLTQTCASRLAEPEAAVPMADRYTSRPYAQGYLSGSGADSAVGRDVLVPWHVPLHRAEAAALAAQQAGGRSGRQYDEAHIGQTDESHQLAGPSGVAVGAVDAQKGTVMFNRYYHLFREAELCGLAEHLCGVGSIKTFYDKSNWFLECSKL